MTERLTVYVGPPLAAALAALPDQPASARINTLAERYLAMVCDELQRLPLTRAEWCALLDANNGLASAIGGVELMPGEIWANIAESPGLSDKWGINASALAAGLAHFPRATLVAVAEAIERFWAHSDLQTDAALAAAGIRPSG